MLFLHAKMCSVWMAPKLLISYIISGVYLELFSSVGMISIRNHVFLKFRKWWEMFSQCTFWFWFLSGCKTQSDCPLTLLSSCSQWLWPLPIRWGPKERYLAGSRQSPGLLHAEKWGESRIFNCWLPVYWLIKCNCKLLCSICQIKKILNANIICKISVILKL